MIKNAKFIISSTDYKKCPQPTLPEYAFIGRSNVGKSSLINSIVNQKNLAKVSSKPGKTQLINHFLINDKWYLVDLPGFGYAKISKTKRQEFQKMTSNYLSYRDNLMCLFVLIDLRLKPQIIDQNFMQWLAIAKIPFKIVFTKSDKVNKNSLTKNIKKYKEYMRKEWEEIPEIFITSSLKKTGLIEIENFINQTNKLFIQNS
ncbi:MAG: YihA family ribosome biogenesis GTP-binding protein [Flavobacteriales bacterium]|nr:YihA family ribosome biogenesis GTP-binding protein [Flavobacteriales bacterium]